MAIVALIVAILALAVGAYGVVVARQSTSATREGTAAAERVEARDLQAAERSQLERVRDLLDELDLAVQARIRGDTDRLPVNRVQDRLRPLNEEFEFKFEFTNILSGADLAVLDSLPRAKADVDAALRKLAQNGTG